jgi:mono/diheme cytochrome c family protein
VRAVVQGVARDLKRVLRKPYNGAHLILETVLYRLFRGRATRLILTLAVCTGPAACSRAAPAATEAAGVEAPALFAQACSKCHGGYGRGGLPMVANGPRPIDLTSPDWQRSRSDQDVATVIRNGRGAMPAFVDVLTTSQINALGSYVRRLKHP